MIASISAKAKGPAVLEHLPSHVITNPAKDMEMNIATDTTAGAPGPHKALGLAIYDACTTANNIADLLGFIARTAQACAYNGHEEEYAKFHEIRMMIEGAGRLLCDHVEELDQLSTKAHALGGQS